MLYLASDHRGFALKEKIKQWLEEWGYAYQDLGPSELNPADDYPDFIHPAAAKVAQDPANSRAIVLGASGQGEAMVANRYPGVRAAVFYGGDPEVARLAREHNDANVLAAGVALGSTFAESRPTPEDEIKAAVRLWLETPFSGDARHVRRIAKIDKE